jgi:hypothetical protein
MRYILKDHALQDRWCAALRGGDYRQGQGVLRRSESDGSESFCCLGVFCDLFDPDAWEASNDDRHPITEGYYHRGIGHAMPAETVYVDTGLNQSLAGDLAALNDDNYTFEEIADFIETGNLPNDREL